MSTQPLEPTTTQRPDSPVLSRRAFVTGAAAGALPLALPAVAAAAGGPSSRLSRRMLTLGPSVWSVGSSMFNRPNLIGQVSERTALEAMIMHSDNTATDMMFNLVKQALS